MLAIDKHRKMNYARSFCRTQGPSLRGGRSRRIVPLLDWRVPNAVETGVPQRIRDTQRMVQPPG